MFFVFSMAVSIEYYITEGYLNVFLIYVTNINLTITTIVALLIAILNTIYFCDGFKIKSGTPFWLKIYWVLWNQSTAFALAIDVFYWSILYNGEGINLAEIVLHITNCLVLILDLFVVRNPPRFSLVIYACAIEIIYVFFTLVYTVNGGLNK